MPGSLIAERYRIVALLGRGGMGEVYRATDLRLGQPVALKFLPEATLGDPSALVRFHNEVRIARQVSHPNVCRVYDIGDLNGQPYLSMEYVDGEDLASLLLRVGRIPHDRALAMARQLCAGLAAAHDKGVLHRDLKPANVMVDRRGQILITDFGLAALADQIRGAEVRHGTPAYMAPEQLSGKEVTVRSDIYSLGIVLYELFTGKRAFEANTLAELVRAKETSSPERLTTIVKDLDPAVERVVMRCVDADPRNRPPSALAVSAALPGGDPLAAALAAGETPSPELVAAAGEHEGFRPIAAVACLAAIFAALGAVPFLVSRNSWIGQRPLENPPEVLADKARAMLKQFGYVERPLDTARGLEYDQDYLASVERRDRTAVAQTDLVRATPIHFWYRSSPRYLEAAKYDNAGEVTKDDPPLETSGMVSLELDPSGRLEWFQAVPPQVEKPSTHEVDADWRTLFTASGLDASSFREAEPEWASASASDRRMAWVDTTNASALRVEAAWWRGKPVFFALIHPWTRPQRMQEFQSAGRLQAGLFIQFALICIVFIVGCLLARYNLSKDRGDRKGAFRLAAGLLVVSLFAFLLNAHHVPSQGETTILMVSAGIGLYIATLAWVMYMALEPYVRRRWPQTMISWTRFLAGRWRDPLVGAHLLIGVLFGVALTLVREGLAWLIVSRGDVLASTFVNLSTTLGASHAVSALFVLLPSSMLSTLGVFLFYFLLRVFSRREWLSASAFLLIFGVSATLLTSGNPWVAAPIRLLQYALSLTVLLRFGLLPFAAGLYISNLLLIFPITTQLSAWYAGSAWLALGAIVALAVFAFRTSLAGRPLFKGELLDG